MSLSTESMLQWCQTLVSGNAAEAGLSLVDYLNSIPRLESLADLPAGTPVLIRGDVDAKPGAEIGQGDVRLRSMVETLKYGQEKGWKMIIFGHIGRKPEGSLDKVAARIGELVGSEVPLIEDWLDESTMTVTPEVKSTIDAAANGSVIVLQNTRKYDVERVLWKAGEADLPGLVDNLTKLANEVAEKIATVYVNEALSAGSLDASSTVIPAAMEKVALGKYVASEFEGPMMRCLQAKLVVFSGLKIDKLDDLQAMVDRGSIRMVIGGGSLAMALLKANKTLDGQEVCLGLAEDASHLDKPYYIPPERLEQAVAMVREGREKGIEFVAPVDFILGDGQAADTIGPDQQQFDVGPKTSDLFAEKVGSFIAANDGADPPAVAFHNGVLGMFEDERFEDGTRKFVAQLKRMTDAGVEVYVGGGEGGKGLKKYGEENWITHCFTAGGTVLNALGSEPVPYLVALRKAAN